MRPSYQSLSSVFQHRVAADAGCAWVNAARSAAETSAARERTLRAAVTSTASLGRRCKAFVTLRTQLAGDGSFAPDAGDPRPAAGRFARSDRRRGVLRRRAWERFVALARCGRAARDRRAARDAGTAAWLARTRAARAARVLDRDHDLVVRASGSVVGLRESRARVPALRGAGSVGRGAQARACPGLHGDLRRAAHMVPARQGVSVPLRLRPARRRTPAR